jgi:organic hydroperoxide reductase OsmC/OhrA
MSEHNVNVSWRRTNPDFEYKTFDRTHTWRFSGGETVRGSSAPAYFGDPALANPEEGLVAALSSCQMLTFLSIAALKGLVIESYEDSADGELGKNDRNQMFVSKITLRPRVVFSGATPPDADAIAKLHQQAKERCFVANSLITEIVLEPR